MLEEDVERKVDLDKEIKASGFLEEKDQEAFAAIHEHYLDKDNEDEENEEDEEEEEEDEKEDEK